MQKIILSLVVSAFLLVGCSSTKPIDVNTKPIDKPALDLPAVNGVKLDNFQWIVITEDNLDEVIAKLKKTKGDVVLFALTPEGYQALSMNTAKIQQFIKQLQDQQAAYKKYYENGKK